MYRIGFLLMLSSFSALAEDNMDACLLKWVKEDHSGMTAADIRKSCRLDFLRQKADNEALVLEQLPEEQSTELLHLKGRETNFSDFMLQPKPRNFALPLYYTNQINTQAYAASPELQANLSDFEAKFQLGLLHALDEEDFFFHGDGFYFAFTIEAWWQLYSDNISKPFRETNYKPEIFYITPTTWQPFGGFTAVSLGIEHQSNGRGQVLSRSWNRVYAQLMYENDNFALTFKPWWRLPEDEKRFAGDPKGDDNPDIRDYMGHFELFGRYNITDGIKTRMLLRQNVSTGKGAVELGLTFPTVWVKGLEWYVTVFNGYGDSLIDYNHKQTRFGIGLAIKEQ